MSEYQIGIIHSWHLVTINTEDGPYETTVDSFEIGASDQRGHNWARYGATFTTEAGARAFLAANAGSDPGNDPVNWIETEPSYGSEAWDSEAEARLASFEADAYGEPRPWWSR
jgi:hypothetical protein